MTWPGNSPPGIVYSIPYTTTPFVTESLKEVLKHWYRLYTGIAGRFHCSLQSWRATADPDAGHSGVADRHFCGRSQPGFTFNTLTLFWPGACHRHRGGRCDRGG